MRYEKAETVLKLALAMQGTAEGLSLDDIRQCNGGTPLSRRTAERLRDALERVFPQMEQANPGEVPKRWRIRAGTLNGLAAIGADELAALDAAKKLLRRENMRAQAADMEPVTAKLRALLKPPALARLEPDLEALTEAEGFAMRPGPRPKIDAEVVNALREAIKASRKVRLHYRNRGTGRRNYQIVHPYGFLYGSRNYLVAWSENEVARDFRNFSLSDIERIEPLEKYFTRKRGFSLQAYAERSFGVFQEKPVRVVWKFSPKAAPDAKDFLFHPTQKLEPQKDGSLIVRFRAGGLQEMAWHLATWGGEVEVLSPATLRRHVEYATCPKAKRGKA
ncbi:MAG TPA: WYL domain-containing protein [Rhizomicrobium sp.]|jgi:predicted DNA-binding transcriptional regulator YafY|nr:WYL domain-containing protein [Rhizomicrobium sp.]